MYIHTYIYILLEAASYAGGRRGEVWVPWGGPAFGGAQLIYYFYEVI